MTPHRSSRGLMPAFFLPMLLFLACRTAVGKDPCVLATGSKPLPPLKPPAPYGATESTTVAKAAHLIFTDLSDSETNIQVESFFGSHSSSVLASLAMDTVIVPMLATGGQTSPFVTHRAAVLLALRPDGIVALDSMTGTIAQVVRASGSLSLKQAGELLAVAQGLQNATAQSTGSLQGTVALVCALREANGQLKTTIPDGRNVFARAAAADLRVKLIERFLQLLERVDSTWTYRTTASFLRHSPMSSEADSIARTMAASRQDPGSR